MFVQMAQDSAVVCTKMKSSEAEESVHQHNNFVSYKRSLSPREVYTSPLDRSDFAFFGGLLVITLASVATRLYGISEPPHVA